MLSREREEPPRFARPGTFEFEYAKRWKSLDEMEKQQRQQVEKNMQEAREKLEAEMEDAYHEHQANLLRQGGILWCSSVKGIVVFWGVKQCPLIHFYRPSKTTGGVAAYGGTAQSRNAEEKGAAAKVNNCLFIWLLPSSGLVWHGVCLVFIEWKG